MINNEDNNKTQDSIRINRFIASSGYCSRREADKLIEAGKVTINDQEAELGTKVTPGDKVVVEGKIISKQTEEDLVYLAFNKPVGIVSTSDSEEPNNIIDYINYPTRIFTIGRLDKDSEGLILLTNDGGVVNKILREEYGHDKEYLVEVDKPYDKAFLKKMASGVEILDRITKPAKIKPVNKTTFKLTITQGLNRQIRRMCRALDYEVVFLRRLRILNIDLGNLKVGKYRYLTPKELKDLFEIIDY